MESQGCKRVKKENKAVPQTTVGTQTTMKGSIRRVSKAEKDQEEKEERDRILKIFEKIHALKQAKIQAAKELLKKEYPNDWRYNK